MTKTVLPKQLIQLSIALLPLALILALTLFVPQLAYAGGTVGDGTPGSCTDAALRFALVGGGLVTFNCGGPHTISLTGGQIDITTDTTIDGGSLITLLGDGSSRIFEATDDSGPDFELKLIGLTVSGGSAAGGAGGAVNVQSGNDLTVINSTLSNNSAAFGGAIYVSGGSTVVITNSAIISNTTTDGDGGGIRVSADGNLTVVNSTLSNNTAVELPGGSTGGDGGAIAILGDTVLVTNTTIFSNSADVRGGGVRIDTGSVSAKNTIIAGNTAPQGNNCRGIITSNGNNLADDFSCSGFVRDTDVLLLGPLADNGGDTPTHALLSGNLAIDTGDDGACPATDQRGVTRPQDGDDNGSAICDIGAFELMPDIPVLTIDKDTSTPNVTAGGVATYRIVIRNVGTEAATGVVVTDILPTNFTYNSTGSIEESSASRTSPINPTLGSDTPVWGTWTVDPNGSVTITFDADVSGSADPGTYHNRAQGDSDETDMVEDDGSESDEDVTVGSVGKDEVAYLPFVMKISVPPSPDLIVENVIATGGSVQIVIRNQGDVPVTDEFWVDFYVAPNPPPTGVNQVWDDGRCTYGAVWGVTAPALSSLTPGGMVTLTVGDAYYWAGNLPASLSPGTPVYAQVDSANTNTTYGAVLENHEISGGSYNNIQNAYSTLGVVGQELGMEPAAGDENQPVPTGNLPPRPRK